MPPESSNRSRKAQKLCQFLYEKAVEDGGEIYVKAKFIADDVGLSSKEIGALMVQLQQTASVIEIEKWSYTSATTWRIAVRDSPTV